LRFFIVSPQNVLNVNVESSGVGYQRRLLNASINDLQCNLPTLLEFVYSARVFARSSGTRSQLGNTNLTKQQTALSRRVGGEPGLQQLGAMQKRITRKEIGSFLAAGLVGHKCLISRNGKANIYPKIIEERMIRRGGAGK
jgi:hypothetical protein